MRALRALARPARRVLLAALAVWACGLAAAPPPAGAASAQVAALQVALRSAGLAPGPVDGITGPRTRAAVRRLQAQRRLAVDGVAGPRTRRALGRRGRPSLGSRPLRSGLVGWDVAALQFLLHARGYAAGGFDGAFGPSTSAAVRRFQRAAGLARDGVAGPATLSALRRRTLPAASPAPSASSPTAGTPSGPVAFLRPIPGAIGDGFGHPGGRLHTGVDIPAASGTAIGAAGRGVVGFAGWNSGGYGNLVMVRHRLGFESWYAHMSRVAVSAGQSVAGGTVLGYVGATGHATGPHLHFEVRLFGTPIDPVPRLLDAVSVARARRAPALCRPNADARVTRDTDPPVARLDRCP